MNDLRQLRHFVAVAEHGHFARAAAAVHLSQPALSRSIQALEAGLGCRLFDRGTRHVVLTAHGQLVLEHARRLLAGSRSLQNAVNQLGNLEAGELCLGAGPFPAARLVPRALARLARRYPKIHVQLVIEDWRSLRRRLLGEGIELFVAESRELLDDPLLAVEPLRPRPGLYFCRPGHPLLEVGRLSRDAIADYPLAGPQLPDEVVDQVRKLSGREQLPDIQCDNFMVLKDLVQHSDVLGLATSDVVAESVADGSLAVLPPVPDIPNRNSAYGLVSRAGHSLSPAAQALRALVLREDEELSA
ncbi:LysR family transcriptional regulator [Zestomonas carbonaria]|uniref:HTH-type transcriptional regulator HdfR n=1 Tax=Zestomonas carbonaria TaxID=2762745 RepID=A0A7U7EKY8_9GAMM|nr:LysR family transcriptional regulator [Pseudomonas carbonaria]CAD5106913.1 HTH-type transcriptional regulator HdfR [Pseudomonas carbonaria]